MTEGMKSQIEGTLKKITDKATIDENGSLTIEELNKLKYLEEFREISIEFKRFWDDPETKGPLSRAIETVANEYAFKPLTILRWLEINPKKDFKYTEKSHVSVEMKKSIWEFFEQSGEIPPDNMEIDEAMYTFGDNDDMLKVYGSRANIVAQIQNIRKKGSDKDLNKNNEESKG